MSMDTENLDSAGQKDSLQLPHFPQGLDVTSFYTSLSITPANVWQNWFKGGQFEKDAFEDGYESWQEPEVVLRLEDPSEGSTIGKVYTCHHCSFEWDDYIGLKSHIKNVHLLSNLNEMFIANESKMCNETSNEEKNGSVNITDVFNKFENGVSNNGYLEIFSEEGVTISNNDKEAETLQTNPSNNPITKTDTSQSPGKKKKFVECPHCDFRCAKTKTLNKHISVKHKDIKPYECTFCQFSSFYPKVLKRHIKSKHPFIKPYACSQCLYSSFEESELKIHVINEHTNKLLHNCLYCGYVSSQCSALMAHIKGKHPLEDCSQCPHCYKKSFDSLYPEELKIIENVALPGPPVSNNVNTLQKSVRTPNKIHQCPECEYNTPQLAHLKRHVISNHTFERPYQCMHCSYSTARSDHLRKHVINKHAHNNTFHCSHCTYTSIHATDLKLHIKQAHADNNNATISFDCYIDSLCNPIAKRYKCTQCDYISPRQDNLRRHILAQHSDLKCFQCSFCCFRTYRMDKLKDHTFARHSDQIIYMSNSEPEFKLEENL